MKHCWIPFHTPTAKAFILSTWTTARYESHRLTKGHLMENHHQTLFRSSKHIHTHSLLTPTVGTHYSKFKIASHLGHSKLGLQQQTPPVLINHVRLSDLPQAHQKSNNPLSFPHLHCDLHSSSIPTHLGTVASPTFLKLVRLPQYSLTTTAQLLSVLSVLCISDRHQVIT